MAYRPNIKNADGTLKDLPLEAETAVKLKTPRSISLSGVVATAQNFDGTSAITIPVTAVPATLLTGTGNIDITGKAARATMDENSNNIASYYLPKSNGTTNGYLAVNNTNSKITQGSVSPVGNNIGANGLMLTHLSNDEGGLLINEDGAYLWNSTDSGSLLKGLDEDVWGNYAGAKKDCTFANGLMFDFDSSGNLKIKGKFYQDDGASPVVVTTISASNVSIVQNPNLGNATTLQGALDYIARVFGGTQMVTRIKAGSFDTN
ncbi:MAG: hypothetical protein RR207_05905 [Clostridia bacterium]